MRTRLVAAAEAGETPVRRRGRGRRDRRRRRAERLTIMDGRHERRRGSRSARPERGRSRCGLGGRCITRRGFRYAGRGSSSADAHRYRRVADASVTICSRCRSGSRPTSRTTASASCASRPCSSSGRHEGIVEQLLPVLDSFELALAESRRSTTTASGCARESSSCTPSCSACSNGPASSRSRRWARRSTRTSTKP